MPRVSKSKRINLWLDRLERQSDSNQTIAQFCAAEGVSAPSFYQWKRRLAARLVEKTEVHPVPPSSGQACFSEIQIVGQASPASVTLPGGIQIHLGTDNSIAATVVDRVLQHASLIAITAKATPAGKSESC